VLAALGCPQATGLHELRERTGTGRVEALAPLFPKTR
jgi:hypothetical protein